VSHGHNWSIVMHVAENSHRSSLRVTRKHFVISCVRGAVLYVILTANDDFGMTDSILVLPV